MIRVIPRAAVAAMILAGSAQATNLVQNGSFENGLANWTIGGADNGSTKYPPAAIFYNSASAYPIGAFGEAVTPDNSVSASPDAVGNRAAYFVSDFAVNQSLSQSVFLASGVYKIGFSAYAPLNGFRNAGDATFSGAIAGVQLANYAVSDGQPRVWQAFSAEKTVNSGSLFDISFVFNTNLHPSKDVVIDRVFITRLGDVTTNAVPEPSSWAMLLAGFGLVGLMSRRSKRAIVVAA
jgi:PEP-CTERM motif